MSTRSHGARRRAAHHEEQHENEERWLVSYADMMTLLFCLFMVLFAISSVNTSKFEALQKALQDAFSGKILSGGEAVMQTGNDKQPEKPGTEPPLPAMTPSLISGSAHSARGVQKRKSQDMAISRPAPRQVPWAASTIGFSMASNSS
jgi:chemotaxis protein MotB